MLPKLALLLTTLSPLVYSASIWGLPNCASSCVTSSFGGCSQIDIECICQNTAFISSLTCCVAKSCDDDEQAAAIQFANDFCGAYHIDLPTAATCASPTTPKATSNTVTAAPTSLLPALSSAASVALANATNWTAGVRNVTVTATVTVEASSTSRSKGGAATVGVGVGGVVLGVGVGVFGGFV